MRKERIKVAQAKINLAFLNFTSKTPFLWYKHYCYKCSPKQMLSMRPDHILLDQATLCLWWVSAVAWVILKQTKEAREKSWGTMQIRGMGHCWVPTDSVLLGRWLWISFPRNVPFMPAATYLGIWGLNSTVVSPLFHGNHCVGRQKRLAAHSTLAPV